MLRWSICFIITLVLTSTAAWVPSSRFPAPIQRTLSSPSTTTTSLRMGIFDDVQKLFKAFTSSASASHILIKSDDGFERLTKIKEEVGNDPIKFADAAGQYSACPSRAKGGALGTFKPGQMVKEFNDVVFNDDVGVVHGPIKTQFGYHLILIDERND